jgi:cytochrome P450 / NADPH-cytochrome P450 reductase
VPFIGNIASFNFDAPLKTTLKFANTYGDIFRFHIGSVGVVVVSSHAFVDEACDEKRFVKIPSGPLHQTRNGVNDGLFTAKIDEPAWGIAHRVLMPAFGPMGIRDSKSTPLASHIWSAFQLSHEFG